MFYKVDISRVTLREYWWETKALVWVGLLIKLFKLRPRASTDDLAVDSLLPFRVEQDAIAPETLQRFTQTLHTLQSLGFEAPAWFHQEDIYQATRNTVAVLRHSSGRAFARVQCRVNHGRVPAKVKFATLFVSPTPGGFIVTGNGKRDLAWPASHDTVRHRLMPVEQVWAEHQQRMTAAVQLIGPGEAIFAAEDYQVSLTEFHVARGVFQPLGDEEMALYSVPVPAAASPVAPMKEPAESLEQPPAGPATSPDLMEVATLAELQKLQNRQVNWRSTIGLLVLSAALFVLQSRKSGEGQNWEMLGIIVGILFFHELGHYVAMKIFGYRNLRMFFIPGFGAAVSGRHYNAPAWKKIVVSLMGPLPGIVVGMGLLVACIFMRNDLLYRIGLFAIIINAFNLLPILPLDGGWVAHAALFSRHPMLDIGFRVLAALGVAAIGVWLPGMHFFLYIAGASLLALPLAYTMAAIVNELRPISGMGVSPDSQSIPPETARLILAKLRQRIKRNLNAKLAAQHVTKVFESLNARPPSIGATLGLLTVHATAFVLALVVAVGAIFVHGRYALARGLVAPVPKYAIAPEQVQPPTQPAAAAARNVVVITTRNASTADGLMRELRTGHRVSRVGQTVFVSFDSAEAAEQRKVFNAYEKQAADIFVDTPKNRSSVRLTFKLPENAVGRQTFDELQAYLGNSRQGLTPPWASNADWPASERRSQTELRRLLQALEQAPAASIKDDAVLWKQISAAQRRGDDAEAERLQSQLRQADKDHLLAEEQRLQGLFGHADFIQAWARIQDEKDFEKQQSRMKQEIVPQLGVWPADKSNDILAEWGGAFDSSLTGKTVGCTFAHIETGLPAMTQWLFSKGASDVHYEIASFSTAEDMAQENGE